MKRSVHPLSPVQAGFIVFTGWNYCWVLLAETWSIKTIDKFILVYISIYIFILVIYLY